MSFIQGKNDPCIRGTLLHEQGSTLPEGFETRGFYRALEEAIWEQDEIG